MGGRGEYEFNRNMHERRWPKRHIVSAEYICELLSDLTGLPADAFECEVGRQFGEMEWSDVALQEILDCDSYWNGGEREAEDHKTVGVIPKVPTRRRQVVA